MPADHPPGPYIRAIGTVQDGGLPHAACSCRRCLLAERDSAFRRHVASLAVILPTNREVYLIDATPDIRAQLARLREVGDGIIGRVDRAPVDGVLLTHAHIGHYLGLAFFGFEAVHTRHLPLYCTPRMAAFLRGHGPWSQLVERANVEVREVAPGGRFSLGPEGGEQVAVEVIQVPHRDELSDTVAFFLTGPRQRLFYVPDTDAWRAWTPPLPEVLADVDLAILDGTFFSLDELPGRDVRSVPHPLIVDTMDLLASRVAAGDLVVYFTHLNHSNPALEPESEARRLIESRGFRVLAEDEILPL